MKINWERLPRLAGPVAVAVFVAVFLMDEFELSRLWAVPIGLWVAVQVQNYMNMRAQAVAQAMEAEAQAIAQPSDRPAVVRVGSAKKKK